MSEDIKKFFDQPFLDVVDLIISKSGRPILVGGLTRDFLLGKTEFKDIDVEVYGLSQEKLKKVLSKFAKVNFVGKHFGVFKIKLNKVEYDFSLPRTEIKTSAGHKGFEVTVNENLTFDEAFSRRDFTINAIGYDLSTDQWIDPFNGKSDLKDEVIKIITDLSFIEDPLRILRAVQFSARFDFKIEEKTISLMEKEVSRLSELPKERIFSEFEKFINKSSRYSKAVELLIGIGAVKVLFPASVNVIFNGAKKELIEIMNNVSNLRSGNPYEDLLTFFTTIFYFSEVKGQQIEAETFFEHFFNEKRLLKDIRSLSKNLGKLENTGDSSTVNFLQKVAIKTKISVFLKLVSSFSLHKALNFATDHEIRRFITSHSIKSKIEPLISGSDLQKLGIPISPKYRKILETMLDFQIEKRFKSKEEAIQILIKQFL